MKALLIFLLIYGITGLVLFCSRRVYCYVFEHKDWEMWKLVLSKFNEATYLEQYISENNPYLDNYKYLVPIDDETSYELIYWVNQGVCGVHAHDRLECIVCGFDTYHMKQALEMVKNRLVEEGRVETEEEV